MQTMLRTPLFFLVLLALGCGQDTPKDYHITLRAGPPPSVPELGTPDGATLIICDTIACCEEALGITSSVCVSLSLDKDSVCQIEAVFDGTPCGSPAWCGTEPTCVKGVCTASEDSVNCADESAAPCHEMRCETATNSCVAVVMSDGEPCEDGSACTTDDLCIEGSCQSGSAPNCDDGNPCTVDDCDAIDGCAYSPLTGQACDDENACTTTDACSAGECVGTGPLDCDTDNPCVVASCDPIDGCQKENLTGTSCEDGNPCTDNDSCQDGQCVPGENTCGCIENSDCPQPDNLCVGHFVCQDNICSGPIDPVVCPESDKTCYANACDPSSGECSLKHAKNDSACDDESACTSNDVCTDGICSGATIECEDEKPCTKNTCDPKHGCLFQPDTGQACDDGDPCTGGDKCAEGICVGAMEIDCDDNNVCTTDSCNWAVGCLHTPVAGSCAGAEPCTQGTCLNGECTKPIPLKCTPKDACTVAKCDPAINDCVQSPIPCDDGDNCTSDACDPATGCASLPIVCDDENACTDDVCTEDGCINKDLDCDDNDPCTTDFCHTGQCVHTALNCTDDNPCSTAECDNGQCVYTLVDDLCNDDNPCTVDSCSDNGCMHKNNPIVCDDGDDCTDEDFCVEQQCVGVSVCDPCTNLPEGAACDDEDNSTIGDLCLAGSCAGFTKTQLKPSGSDKNSWLGDVTWTQNKYWALGGDQKNNRGWIAEIQNNGGIKVAGGTHKNHDTYVAIDHRAAITQKGLVAYHDGKGWKHGTTFHNVFAGISDAKNPTALWGMPTGEDDRWTITGSNTTSGQDPLNWVLHCDRNDNNFNCDSDDDYDSDLGDPFIPQAVMGWPAITTGTTADPEAQIVIGGQFSEPNYPDDVNFNDLYWLDETKSEYWDLFYFDNASQFPSRSIHDIHGTDAKHVWWVGTRGLFGVKTSWNGVAIKELVQPVSDYSSLYLNSVWSTGDVVLAVGTHRYATQDAVLTMLTHATESDPGEAANWTEIPLLTATGAILNPNNPDQKDARGALLGVVVHNGEIVITGWAYSANGKEKQALVLRRTP